MSDLRVKVADYAVSRGEGVISTIGLGSCVAIAIYDKQTRVGGMAHVLLPSEGLSRDKENRAKFPGTAVPGNFARLSLSRDNPSLGRRTCAIPPTRVSLS